MEKMVRWGAAAFLTALVCASVVAGAPRGIPGKGRGAETKVNAPLLTFASNLFAEPCNPTCNYDSQAGGYRVLGPDNCTLAGHTEWFGVAFIAGATGTPTRISAALNLTNAAACPTNTITLSVYTDACFPRGPGRRLVSGIATVPAAPCALAVAKLRQAPVLTSGTKYWVVATTNAQQSGFDAIWYGSNNAQIGLYEGVSWRQANGGTPAFKVEGVATSESATASATQGPVFGSNLFVEPCGACNYDTNVQGYNVRGPDNCSNLGATDWYAVPFISAVTGRPKHIFASMTLFDPEHCQANKVTLSIYTDACYPNGPGTPIVSAVATVPQQPCALTVANLRNAPQLEKGVKYWVVAIPTNEQSDFDAVWHPSNDAQLAYNIGFDWIQASGLTPGFEVR